MEKDEPLDGRKTNKNNKDSEMGQVTHTQKKRFEKKDYFTFIRTLFSNFMSVPLIFFSLV